MLNDCFGQSIVIKELSNVMFFSNLVMLNSSVSCVLEREQSTFSQLQSDIHCCCCGNRIVSFCLIYDAI